MRRLGRAMAVAVSLALAAGGALAPVAGASETVPPWTAERAIGALSSPGVAAWGLAYNPVTDEFAVGDYLAGQVRRFSRDGEFLGDFSNPTPTAGGVVSGLAVDPTQGSTYVAVTGEGRKSLDVRKYDSNGVFLFDIDTPKSTTWVGTGRSGELWVPEAYTGAKIRRYAVDDATKSATLELTIDNPGRGPGQFGSLTSLASDADNNIYVSDTLNRVVHSYTRDGQWRYDIGGPSIFVGDLRGVIVDDATSTLYVANSAAGTIEAFSLAGAHLRTISSEGAGPGQFVDGARQLAVTPDGHVWAADYGQFRVMEFDAAGAHLSTFPNPPMPADPAGMSSARGLDVDPVTGEVVVADSWGQRVLRFSPDGALIQSFGRRGSRPPEGMNYPKSIAINPATRDVWVGNYEGIPYVVGYTSDFSSVVRRIVTPRFITDLKVVGNLLYAVNRRPGALYVYDLTTGALVRQWNAPVGLLRGVDVDPVTGNVWLTQETKKNVLVVSPDNILLKTIPIVGAGWGVAVRGDLVYVANTQDNAVNVIDRVSMVQVAKIGSKGPRLGQFAGPTSVKFGPDNKMYVLEERNGRVQVFTSAPAPAGETTKPTISHDLSASGVVNGQLVATGSVADDTAVGQVEALVQDRSTGLYYDARVNTWVSAFTWNPAAVWGPGSAGQFRFTLPQTLPGRSYTVKVRALDLSKNISAVATRVIAVP